MKFEVLLKSLEDLIVRLENGDLSLEESITIYETGMQLVKKGESHLQQMQGKIEELSNTEKI